MSITIACHFGALPGDWKSPRRDLEWQKHTSILSYQKWHIKHSVIRNYYETTMWSLYTGFTVLPYPYWTLWLRIILNLKVTLSNTCLSYSLEVVIEILHESMFNLVFESLDTCIYISMYVILLHISFSMPSLYLTVKPVHIIYLITIM
jgi:hypothetical protein